MLRAGVILPCLYSSYRHSSFRDCSSPPPQVSSRATCIHPLSQSVEFPISYFKASAFTMDTLCPHSFPHLFPLLLMRPFDLPLIPSYPIRSGIWGNMAYETLLFLTAFSRLYQTTTNLHYALCYLPRWHYTIQPYSPHCIRRHYQSTPARI